jgi:hypothetical protein
MKNVWRGICIAIFVFGAASLLQASKRAAGFQLTNRSVDVSDTEPGQAFVVEYVDSSVSSDGTVAVTGRTTRYVKADGEWRLVLRRNTGQTSSSDGSKEVAVYGGTSDGVFEKKSNSATRRYVSPSSDQSILQLYRSHNYLRNQREFVRTDDVAGLKVYVLRIENTDIGNPEEWLERSYSPTTGLTILKFVSHMRDGSEIRREAVSVVFKDVPEDLNHDLKNLPITPKEKNNQ